MIQELNEHLSGIPESQRPAIAGIVELTVATEMKQVLAKLDSMQMQFDAIYKRFDDMQRTTEKRFDDMKWLYLATVSLCAFMVTGLGVFLKFYPG